MEQFKKLMRKILGSITCSQLFPDILRLLEKGEEAAF